MPTTIFDGNVAFKAATFESPALNVTGRKQPGQALTVTVFVEAAAFPDPGTTTLIIFFSFDGGVTWPRSAQMTVVRPREVDPRSPAFETMGYSLGVNDSPTHAKYGSLSPAVFNAHVIVTTD